MQSLKTPEKNYQNSIAAPDAIYASTDELKLACQRSVFKDYMLRGFVDHPYLHSWIREDFDSLVEQLRIALAAGYRPSRSHFCWVPKSKSLLRPANILTLADEVIYTFLAGRLYVDIWNAIGKYQGNPDMCHQLYSPHPGRKDMVENSYVLRPIFKRDRIEKMKPGEVQHVVVTDMTGFYENIDHEILLSDLWQITDLRVELDLLGKCLRKWSYRKNKGIPQAYPASHMFAKVYASPIDSVLRINGYTHLRWVDDIIIFCKSYSDAKRAIMILSDIVHKRGLNLHSEKTDIMTKSEALSVYKYPDDIIEEIDAEIDKRPESKEEILMKYLSNSVTGPFKRDLFFYILTELMSLRSKTAVEICFDTLGKHPEVTDGILAYFSMVKLSKAQVDRFVSILISPDLIYDYQAYQILKWLWENKVKHEKVLNICREWSKDRNRDLCLRSYAFAYLGEFGDESDHENIKSLYFSCTDDVECCDCIAALRRQETGERNAFYEHVKDDSFLIKRAVEFERENGG